MNLQNGGLLCPRYSAKYLYNLIAFSQLQGVGIIPIFHMKSLKFKKVVNDPCAVMSIYLANFLFLEIHI